MRSGVHGGTITSLTSTSPTPGQRPSTVLVCETSCGPAGQAGLVIVISILTFGLVFDFLQIDHIDQTQVDDVDEQLGIDDLLERFANDFFG